MNVVIRTKLEIFVEAHALGDVEHMLARAGFKGCSVFQGVEGSGSHGAWRQTGVDEAGMRLIITIGSEAAAQTALIWLEEYFSTYPGVVAISEVKVLRPDRF
jgi:PII-like signaling protein